RKSESRLRFICLIRTIFSPLSRNDLWREIFKRRGRRPMSLKHRLKKLEKAIGTLPCSTCREWWQQPLVIRDETDPPVPRDPDLCLSCGRQCPRDTVFEI